MVAKNIFRMIVMGFFAMTWSFILMPALESAGVTFTTIDRVVSYIITPLTGLLVAQLLMRKIRDG